MTKIVNKMLFLPSKIKAVTTFREVYPTEQWLCLPFKIKAVTTKMVYIPLTVKLCLPFKIKAVTTNPFTPEEWKSSFYSSK
jgi:hypothetical protein